NFDHVCRRIAEKLIHRHPHVFGRVRVANVDGVWAQWEKIKRAEKAGTRRARPSALDGIPKYLPALLRAEKLVKKAQRAGLLREGVSRRSTRAELAGQLFALAEAAQSRGWSAEELLRNEIRRRERVLRVSERRRRATALRDDAIRAAPA